jgi:hypothetical protein
LGVLAGHRCDDAAMKITGLLALIGVALLGAGLTLGLLPVRAEGVDCGSALHASTYGGNRYLGGDVCDGPRSGRQGPAVTLLIVGGALLCAGGVGALIQADQRRKEQPPAAA